MDKETLSNYGWIVICVMVLAVMLAFASPFGNFVANAIKSTTQGLFDVNQGALDSAGIEIMQQEFETMLNGETQNGCPIKYGQEYAIAFPEVSGAYYAYIFYEDGSLEMSIIYNGQLMNSETAPAGTVGYDGMNLTGVDEETGETIIIATITADGKQIDMGDGMILTLHEPLVIPTGGTYYVGVTSKTTGNYSGATAVYTAGEYFPKGASLGDIYVYGDYEYRFNQANYEEGWADVAFGGWNARVIDDSKTQYGEILESINGCNVSWLMGTFSNCKYLEIAPSIPNVVDNIAGTFSNCPNLKTYIGSSDPDGDFSGYIIPQKVDQMSATFERCSSLVVAPVIPNGVVGMSHTFQKCTNLTTAPVLPASVGDMQQLFEGCSNLKTYHGSTDPDGDFSNYIIPTNNDFMMFTFKGCTKLTKAPVIPVNVIRMYETFANCTSLSGTIVINTNVITTNIGSEEGSCRDCFKGVDMTNITLTGSASKDVLNLIGATGNNWTPIE